MEKWRWDRTLQLEENIGPVEGAVTTIEINGEADKWVPVGNHEN
jgi:hypothetical protein